MVLASMAERMHGRGTRLSPSGIIGRWGACIIGAVCVLEQGRRGSCPRWRRWWWWWWGLGFLSLSCKVVNASFYLG